MKIAIASDHAGFHFKEKLKDFLARKGHDVDDCGAASDEPSDYPPYAKDVARRVSKGKADRGVLVCGSGIGMCIVANRFPGVRAAVLRDACDVEMGRRHNDINVACLGGRITDEAKAFSLIEKFLDTCFEGGRHAARIEKIDGGD